MEYPQSGSWDWDRRRTMKSSMPSAEIAANAFIQLSRYRLAELKSWSLWALDEAMDVEGSASQFSVISREIYSQISESETKFREFFGRKVLAAVAMNDSGAYLNLIIEAMNQEGIMARN